MDSHIALLGGYPSGGGCRDPNANQTIIDGGAKDVVVKIAHRSDVTIDGFTIQNGSAVFGAGIYCSSSSPTLTDCTIRGNAAGDQGSGGGAGIYCSESSPTLTNCTISGNTASIWALGGGIRCASSSPTLTNCTISGNTVGSYGQGGGIYCSESTPTLTNCTISGNTAYGGGGIRCDESCPVLTNCAISGNTVEGSGGGIYCYYGSATLTDCTISGNTADYGGIYCYHGSPTLMNCTVTKNKGDVYGGIFCSAESSATLTNCAISGNTGIVGGIYCDGSSPALTNCTISGNTAEYGGGIGCTRSYPTLSNCTISGNMADYGGGIYCRCSTHAELTNCLIVNNSADYGGGLSCHAWYDDGPSSVRLAVCTIADNTASEESGGGGIYCDTDCTVTVKNSILWGDAAEGATDEINGSGTITVTYTDIEGGWEGEGNIDDDPLFVEGYYLSQTAAGQEEQSPCVDAGEGSASENGLDAYTTRTDLEPDAGVVDMGYHYECESSGPHLSSPAYSPGSGLPYTDFTFTVDYYSEDGYSPSLIEVVVNGTSHTMALDSGTAAAGTYAWTGNIPEEGTAQYHLQCDDGHGGSHRLPSEGEMDGPVVYEGDSDPPSSCCTAPPVTPTPEITVNYTSSDTDSGVDEVALWMRTEGGDYEELDSSDSPNGSFEVTLSSGNGAYDFYTIATDKIGNVEDPPTTPDATTIHDSEPPASSVDGGDEYTNTTQLVVSFSASDSLTSVETTSLWYSFEDGSWTDSGLSSEEETGTFSFTVSKGEGSYAFYTVSTDIAGNAEEAPASADWIVVFETAKPQSSCTCENRTNKPSLTVGYEATDNYEIADVALWYAFGGGGWTNSGLTGEGDSGGIPFPFPYGDGIYEFYTIARDRAGNVEEPPGTADASVEADLTDPQSSCWADDIATTAPFTVQFEASDSYSGIDQVRLFYRLQGDAEWVNSLLTEQGEAGSFSLDPTILTPEFGDGIYELMTVATDTFGNDEPAPTTPDDAIIFDTTPPQCSLACAEWKASSPLALTYTASDALTGATNVSLWYRFESGEWQDTGQSASAESGEFSFNFPFGEGLYEFTCVATDGAGNTGAPTQPDASCILDATPPESYAWTEGAVNDPSIEVNYEAEDALTPVASVHLYYRFATLDGDEDDTLRDTELDEEHASGAFVWEPDIGPGYYRFHVAATDAAGNVEAISEEPDSRCLFDPALALSEAHAPEFVSQATIAVSFTIDIGEGGYQKVTLYYRYGASAADAAGADWVTTAAASFDTEGTWDFACENGDGYYQFSTRAENASGLLEPMPERADATTAADSLPPATSLSAEAISPSSEFEISLSVFEPFGIDMIDIFSWHEGSWSLFTTVEHSGESIAFDAEGQEGEYRFYSIGTDLAGNVEQPPEAGYDCVVYVDLSKPTSSCSVEPFGTGFPINVSYSASDTVTDVADVSLWAKFEGGAWENTGLSGSGDSGTLHYAPATPQEGAYYFYTLATDGVGRVEGIPAGADDEIEIDWTPPETGCTAPAYTNDAVIDVTCTANDAISGVHTVSVWVRVGEGAWLDSGESGSADGGVTPVDVSAWGEGSFGFCTRGLDKAGNVEALPDIIPAVTIYDATAPESAAGLPSEGVFANCTPVEVPYSAHDALSGLDAVELWFRFSGGDWEASGLTASAHLTSSTEGTFSFMPSLGDGTYEFATRALDNAGNLEALPASPDGGALVFDQTAPASSVSYGSEFASGFPITLPFTAGDSTSGIASVSFWVSFNDSAFEDTGLFKTTTSGSFEFTPDTIAEGRYRFYSMATDKAGNVEAVANEADAAVVFDLTAPVSEAEVGSEYTKEFPIEVAFTAGDGGSGLVRASLWASFNGGEFADTGLHSANTSGTFDYTPSTVKDGTYAFYTRATDVAGNVEPAPGVEDASIIVDRTKPTSSCTASGALTNSFPILLGYTSSDVGSGVNRVKLFSRLNGGDWAEATTLPDGSGSFDFTPAKAGDGYYEFYTRAHDKASNSETTNGPDCGITVDTTPPRSSASSPSRVTEASFSVGFEAKDDGCGVADTALWYRFNDGVWADTGLTETGDTGAFLIAASDGEGTYSFYTVSTDNAGNVETVPSSPDTTTEYRLPIPMIRADVDSLGFGQVVVGNNGSRKVILDNVGDADLSITNVWCTDASFSANVNGALPTTLKPMDVVEVEVVFSPNAEGDYEGELAVESNDSRTQDLRIGLTGEGVAAEFTVGVRTDSADYAFGESLCLELSVVNTGAPVSVDFYLVLTYDLNGPEERNWFASADGGWAEHIAAFVSAFEVPGDLEFSMEWWSSNLPCPYPLISRTGTYTLRMAAFEPGGFDLVSNIAESNFYLTGRPFISPKTHSDSYWLAGDRVLISLSASMPDYSVASDLIVVLKTPDGRFFSPGGFGADAQWAERITPLLSSIRTAPNFQLDEVFWEVNLPAPAPFDTAGQFVLMSALVEPGTLRPVSDIGITTFILE